MRNIKYKSKRLWSALDKAEGPNGAADTVTAYEFASALTGLGRTELKKRIDGRDADAGAEAYLYDRNSVLKALIDRDKDGEECRFAAVLLNVSEEHLQDLLEQYEDEHREYHVEISCECASMSVFSLTVTGKEMDELEKGEGKLLEKLFARTIRAAVKDRDFTMDYAVYDNDKEKDIISWSR